MFKGSLWQSGLFDQGVSPTTSVICTSWNLYMGGGGFVSVKFLFVSPCGHFNHMATDSEIWIWGRHLEQQLRFELYGPRGALRRLLHLQRHRRQSAGRQGRRGGRGWERRWPGGLGAKTKTAGCRRT